jgi:hypothetical protein
MKSVTVLTKKKDCKGSVCFENKDPKAALSSAYVNRIMSGINEAETITVTIEVGGTPAAKAPTTNDAVLLAALR